MVLPIAPTLAPRSPAGGLLLNVVGTVLLPRISHGKEIPILGYRYAQVGYLLESTESGTGPAVMGRFLMLIARLILSLDAMRPGV